MPVTNYPYTKAANPTQLENEIQASAIVTALESIVLNGTDGLNVSFKDALSSGDETLLDGLVAAHTPAPTVDTYIPKVQPTVTYNEHLLVPKGMRKIKFQADQYCKAITLSNRNGSTFNYTCDLTPVVNGYVVQNDCYIRFFITAVDTQAGTITLGSPDGMDLDDLDLQQTILLSNPFESNCTIEFENYEILYLWGLTLHARNFGDDDILNLRVMVSDGQGGMALVKPYERTWVSNVDKVGLIKTPDEAPGEIPAGIIMQIQYFTFKSDATIIHANYDYILTVK